MDWKFPNCNSFEVSQIPCLPFCKILFLPPISVGHPVHNIVQKPHRPRHWGLGAGCLSIDHLRGYQTPKTPCLPMKIIFYEYMKKHVVCQTWLSNITNFLQFLHASLWITLLTTQKTRACIGFALPPASCLT
jgi:hypothetical protein